MRIISKSVLREFWTRFPDAESPLRSWWTIANGENWSSFADIRRTYNSADHIGSNRVVFNVGGNKYRLVVAFDFAFQMGFVRFVGTHSEYDKINAETI